MITTLELELMLSLYIKPKYWPGLRRSAKALGISPTDYILRLVGGSHE